MGNKRGQVTIFVIIAIAIIVLALILFFVFKGSVIFPKKEPYQIIETKEKVNSIIKESTYDVIYKIGEQGGYLELPLESLITEKKQIAYSVYFGKNRLSSLNNIENEVSDYIEETIAFYLNDYYSEIEYFGENIEFGLEDIQSKTTIKNDEIVVETKIPTKIRGIEDETFYLDSYTTIVPSQFGYVYSIAEGIVQSKLKHQTIDESYFRDKDISVDVIPVDSTKIIYSLKKFDNINNETFVFNVGVFEP